MFIEKAKEGFNILVTLSLHNITIQLLLHHISTAYNATGVLNKEIRHFNADKYRQLAMISYKNRRLHFDYGMQLSTVGLYILE